jgi:hypothetical protein
MCNPFLLKFIEYARNFLAFYRAPLALNCWASNNSTPYSSALSASGELYADVLLLSINRAVGDNDKNLNEVVSKLSSKASELGLYTYQGGNEFVPGLPRVESKSSDSRLFRRIQALARKIPSIQADLNVVVQETIGPNDPFSIKFELQRAFDGIVLVLEFSEADYRVAGRLVSQNTSRFLDVVQRYDKRVNGVMVANLSRH